MSEIPFEEVVALALQLSPTEQARLMEQLAVAIQHRLTDEPGGPEEIPWTPEEVSAMMKVEPMTGAQIVAAGLTGTWADLGINDGSTWVNERKRRRRERLSW